MPQKGDKSMERTPKINADGKVVTEEGEILDPAKYKIIVVPEKRQKMKERDWFMAYNVAFKALAKDKEMRGEPRALLDFLMAIMDFENFLAIDQTYIAKELDINKANVSKAMKVLVEKKILKKGPKVGRSNTYKMNDYYAWRGSVENKRKAQILDITKARRRRDQE